MSRIILLKFIDSLLGRVVASLLPPPTFSGVPAAVRSILIIRPGGIGDAILLAPAILMIRAQNPSLRITVLAEKRNAGVFPLMPAVDAVLCYDRPGDLLRAMGNRYDVVIDTEQWHRLSAIIARINRAPVKIGFGTNNRRRLFTHPLEYSQERYEVDSFKDLLGPLGIPCGPSAPMECDYLDVPPENLKHSLRLLPDGAAGPFVTIFPGASVPERQWEPDRFREIAVLLQALGVRSVVVGGNDDRRLGELIVAGNGGVNLAGTTSLAETAAIIKRSCLLLSGDSGCLHIGVGLGVPTVSLFGPGRALKWAPRGEHHLVINKGLACSPCTTFGSMPQCPRDARCMKEITVDEVFNAVTVLLTSTGAIQSRCCKRDWIETAG